MKAKKKTKPHKLVTKFGDALKKAGYIMHTNPNATAQARFVGPTKREDEQPQDWACTCDASKKTCKIHGKGRISEDEQLLALCEKDCASLRKQLAAEREKHSFESRRLVAEAITAERTKADNLCKWYQEQLAAADESGWQRGIKYVEQLRGIIKDWQDFGSKLSKILDGVSTNEWLESAKALQKQLAAANKGWKQEVMRADTAEAAVGENCRTIERLEQELAAERKDDAEIEKLIATLQEQLAAERERVNLHIRAHEATSKQLTAEREKRKVLVEALKALRIHRNVDYWKLIDNALAKVKQP
jgi:hypothetical protein